MFYEDSRMGMAQGNLHKEDDSGGSWITMNGSAVHLNSEGVADKGPKGATRAVNAKASAASMGTKASSASDHLDAAGKHAQESKDLAARAEKERGASAAHVMAATKASSKEEMKSHLDASKTHGDESKRLSSLSDAHRDAAASHTMAAVYGGGHGDSARAQSAKLR